MNWIFAEKIQFIRRAARKTFEIRADMAEKPCAPETAGAGFNTSPG